MTDSDLFSDIDVPTHALPLGGVSKRAFKLLSWSKAVLARAGQPSAYGRSGWIEELQTDITLDEIRLRAERNQVEHSVSVTIDGEVLTGANYIDHDAFVEEMHAQGYKLDPNSFGWDGDVLFERWLLS